MLYNVYGIPPAPAPATHPGLCTQPCYLTSPKNLAKDYFLFISKEILLPNRQTEAKGTNQWLHKQGEKEMQNLGMSVKIH